MDYCCRIEMLGGFQVIRNQQTVVRFHTRKAAALLAYLSLHPDRRHSRERLAEMLWPENDPEAARASLRVALASLRRQLEPPGTERGALICADRSNVGLNREAFTTDVSDFRVALQSARRAQSPEAAIPLLEQAVRLYRGELLPGFYEDWVLRDQERLAGQWVQALRDLSDWHDHAGNCAAAVRYAQRAAAADPEAADIQSTAADLRPVVQIPQSAQRGQASRGRIGLLPDADSVEGTGSAVQVAASPGPAPGALQAVGQGALPAPSGHLPSGVVTTLLAELEAAEPKDALRRVRQMRERLLLSYGGLLVREQPTSFAALFRRASDAAACAVAFQRDLLRPALQPLRARIALHTAESATAAPAQDPLASALPTRLLMAAHLGQTLCSEEAATFLSRSIDPAIQLIDLGLYRLTAEDRPAHLFQLHYFDAPARFPRPAADLAYAGRLPLTFTRFFGRQAELAQLGDWLQSGSRLITLTGPGGSGKTRLATEAARQLLEDYHGAVWFVPLAGLSDPDQLLEAVQDGLDLPRVPDREPLHQIAEILGAQQTLLILDNLEHLVRESAELVRELLERIPSMTCLCTSRCWLNLEGERLLDLRPLMVPTDGSPLEVLAGCESVQLFVDRAQSVRSDFQLTAGNAREVAEICRRLEGIPLALELAAAWSNSSTPGRLLAQMERRMDFLVSRHAPSDDRHQTLKTTIDWSYQLLSPQLQRFFRQLAVFRGGWSLQAATGVLKEPMALDYLAELREASLIQVDPPPTEPPEIDWVQIQQRSRFSLLETLREYAWNQLVAADEVESARDAHLEYFLALAEEGQWHLVSETAPGLIYWYEVEQENLRVAFQRALERDAVRPTRLANALAGFSLIPGRIGEALQLVERALAATDPQLLQDAPAEERMAYARCLRWAAVFTFNQGNSALARQRLTAAWEIVRTLDDCEGLAAILGSLGGMELNAGNYAEAQRLYGESLALRQSDGQDWGVGQCLLQLGDVAFAVGDLNSARSCYAQSRLCFGRVGDSHGDAMLAHRQSCLALQEGNFDEAEALLNQSHKVFEGLGSKVGRAVVLKSLGDLAFARGDAEPARQYYRQSLAIVRELGDRREIASLFESLAAVAQVMEDLPGALRLFGAAERLREAYQSPMHPFERAAYEKHIQTLSCAVRKAAFLAGWKAGRDWTAATAAGYALGFAVDRAPRAEDAV